MLAPLNRAELTLTIPQPGAHLGMMGGGASMMDMSPAAAGSYQLPSPSFNNFMLTLSPLMQLSSPQATMSPREDGCGLGGSCAPVVAVPSAMYVCAAACFGLGWIDRIVRNWADGVDHPEYSDRPGPTIQTCPNRPNAH